MERLLHNLVKLFQTIFLKMEAYRDLIKIKLNENFQIKQKRNTKYHSFEDNKDVG